MAQLTAKTETTIESECVKVSLYVIRDDGSYGGWRTELLVEEITKIEAKFLLCNYCRGMLRDACLFEKDGKQELACSVCVPKDEIEIIAQLNRDSVLEREVSLINKKLRNQYSRTPRIGAPKSKIDTPRYERV